MHFFHLEKPDLSKINDRKFVDLFMDPEKYAAISPTVQAASTPMYLYWDKVKYKSTPANIKPEELWLLVKFSRSSNRDKQHRIVKAEDGEYFSWGKLIGSEEFFHEIDLNTGGSLLAATKDIEEHHRYRFLSRGIMEEAIASSQLEGANTTREIAKQFLREKRKPRTKDEQMILNNYQTMLTLENQYRDKPLSLDVLLELHHMICDNTTAEDGEPSRLRNKNDKIYVMGLDDIVYHKAPPIDFVLKELEKFIRFANDELGEPFIHPVIKAIILHFWMGYLHPFTDGNGRLARVLFYWYLLKRGYWAFAYLPISAVIKRSPMQYTMAYIYSERDEYDLTYFIDYNLRKIKQALQEFEQYVKNKAQENRQMNIAAKQKYALNERQIQVLQYLQKGSDTRTSPKVYMNVYQVSKKTAITDLKKLEGMELLHTERKGRNVYYSITEKAKQLFT